MALLCPEYRDMQLNLSNKLMLNFGNQIMIVCNVGTESELEGMSFSILFTTIPVKRSYPGTVIHLSPFNLHAQYPPIQNAILDEQERHKNHILKKNFRIFFEDDLFVTNPDIENRDQIIAFLCERLYAKKYVESDFTENVYRRENAATTAFGHIAIPHSVDMDAIKTCVSVAISKKGFHWGANTVHLVLLLAINRADKTVFRELCESLINLFQEENILHEVRNCISLKDFKQLIYNHIDSLL